MKPGPKRTETWGLAPCPPQRACKLCAALGEQLGTLRSLRDAYVQGVPIWLLARTFAVPNGALRRHAWLSNWCRRRAINLPSPRYLLTQLALLRARDTWHLADGNSATRALELLIKLAQEPDTEERQPGLTWEDWVHQDEAAGENILSPQGSSLPRPASPSGRQPP